MISDRCSYLLVSMVTASYLKKQKKAKQNFFLMLDEAMIFVFNFLIIHSDTIIVCNSGKLEKKIEAGVYDKLLYKTKGP